MDDQQQPDSAATPTVPDAPSAESLPEIDELRAVTAELDDVELVLNNLERDTQGLDATCQAEADSDRLSGRPALDLYRRTRIAAETPGSPTPAT